MQTLKMYASSVNQRYVDQVVEALREGGIVIIPTDTRYAIACDALNNRAIERVCQLKGIDSKKHPLSIVCSDISQASDYASIDNRAYRMLRDTLPGPYTYILPTTPRLPKAFKGRREVGLRIPDNDITRELAHALGNPLMVTTVTWPDADDADTLMPIAIADAMQHSVDLLIDAGDCTPALSTVIDLTDSTNPVTLRE